ncbi:MAG: tryptophanase [Candidatus Zixiibacteriota bacterium]
MHDFDYSPEPFRIKSVEPIRLLDQREREERLRKAHYNIFKLLAQDVYVDLLTDSGTGAMSTRQWAALMMGDESYAGAVSFQRFESTIQRIFRKRFVIPTHQGRAAEHLLFSVMVRPGQYVLNNTHFDTTRANTLHKGGQAVDLPAKESVSDSPALFKGNMDTVALEAFLKKHDRSEIAMVIMTVTNNSVGGQPVSIQNIADVSEICGRYSIPFFIDAARFAENCWFIHRDEPEYKHRGIEEIAHTMFDLCDGVMMSAKKDGIANMGGFIALNDESVCEKVQNLMVVTEGFLTYGGLSGREMETVAAGLEDVLQMDYLSYRIGQVASLGDNLKRAGMPIVEPTGGHAVFIDAGKLLQHIPSEEFPGQALAVEFYRLGGVRVVEIGTLMNGGTDPNTGASFTSPKELVRLALPRRVYTSAHCQYVAKVAAQIVARKKELRGYRITHSAPLLRHFTCHMAPMVESSVEKD